MNVRIECVNCSRFFWAEEDSIWQQELLCGGCVLDALDWKVCKECGSKVSVTPCFICKLEDVKNVAAG